VSHQGFRHEDVFDQLYKVQCWEAWNKRTGLDPSVFCSSILAHLGRNSREMSPTRNSASIRRTALNDFYRQWKGLYSTNTCFLCLCRSPEHMLPCHHAICDTCVVIFGFPSKTAEYHFCTFPNAPCAGRVYRYQFAISLPQSFLSFSAWMAEASEGSFSWAYYNHWRKSLEKKYPCLK
jgi:hypothetical protein